MKVNHLVCKFCIYSEYIANKGYYCSKKDMFCEVLEKYEFDCPYHNELGKNKTLESKKEILNTANKLNSFMVGDEISREEKRELDVTRKARQQAYNKVIEHINAMNTTILTSEVVIKVVKELEKKDEELFNIIQTML